MFKKVLIISDNLFLCKRFKEIIEAQKFVKQEWVFAISPSSDFETFEKELGVRIQKTNLGNSETVRQIIQVHDLVFSVHCKQLFPKELVESIKCINLHPGYNPINRGWYPQVFAIIHNLPVGATLHEMDAFIDHGEIIDRVQVKVNIYDTSETLYDKIIKQEIRLIKKNLYNIIYKRYSTVKPESKGNIFYKKDFENLRKLDLEKKTSGLEFINLLRALSHNTHNNAFFIDPATGRKVYIKICLKPEDNG